MDFHFRSIILFITDRCSVACPTCNISARSGGKVELSPEWLDRFLPRLKAFQKQIFIIWTGGEPFEAFESLLAGIRIATKLGYRSEILTSGCWYEHHPDYLSRLAEAGELHLRISLDAEHQRSVDMDVVHFLVDDILERRVPLGFTLRTIPGIQPSPDDIIERLVERHPVLKILRETSSRLFHVIPTIPKGPSKGQNRLSAGEKQTAFGPCKLGFRDLVIGPDGRLFPCCGLFGLGIDDRIVFGDALTDFPEPAFTHLVGNSLFQELITRGPYALAQEKGIIPDPLPASGYTGCCHVCRMVLPLLLPQLLPLQLPLLLQDDSGSPLSDPVRESTP